MKYLNKDEYTHTQDWYIRLWRVTVNYKFINFILVKI